ncbi:MAG: MotA/TolQ/ExbB proton channel family protein [Methylococcaceae bacterium]|nr:MotA/TolQ/ExbB proton channel family protein [Methylococcaceae bacterium]
MDLSETSIVNATLWLLGCFSLLTWSIILLKLGEWGLNVSRNYAFSNKNPTDPEETSIPSFNLFDKSKSQRARIYYSGQAILNQIPTQALLNLEQSKAWHTLIEKTLHQQLLKEKSVMESGLGWLASFGSTSPFVGLFGTVWGIMHALQDISSKGSASLEVVAGPIGEALIATAIGIAVAIPAVLAYNFFVRLNKSNLSKLDHFANDYLRNIIQQDLQQQTVSMHGLSNAR